MLIYHLAAEREFLNCIDKTRYKPESLQKDGFIHCSPEVSVLSVANEYYASLDGRLLLIKIEPDKLTSLLKYEKAKPTNKMNMSHISSSPIFPHVYGPIDLSAIAGIGILQKEKSRFVWPTKFISMKTYLSKE